MRIVIEIDRTDTGVVAGPQSLAPSVRIEGAFAPAPEPVPGGNLGETPPAAPAANPMSVDAGMAESLAPAISSEAPAELLARAAALNALNAGLAPGFVAGSLVRTAVTEADSPQGVSTPSGADSNLSPCSLEAVYDGGITNAGPAPR